MGCCCGKSKNKPIASIVKSRWCTDIPFLIAFLAGFGVLVVLMQLALQAGADPMRVLRGTDYNGNVCGLSTATKDYPYAAWPYPLDYDLMICVKNCSYTNNCSSTQMAWRYESVDFMGAYCIPTLSNNTIAISITGTGSIGDVMDQGAEVASRVVTDAYTAWMYLLISPAVAIVVTFIFMLFLKRFAGCLTLITLTLMEAGIIGLGVVAYMYSSVFVQSGYLTTEQGKYMEYTSYGIFGVAGLFLLILLFLRKQIMIAVGVVKEAAEAINDMKLLVFFPIIPAIFLVAYVFLWIVVSLYLASVTTTGAGGALSSSVTKYGLGFESCTSLLTSAALQGHLPTAIPNDLASVTNTTTFTRDYMWQYALAYNFFHLLWVIQFFFYFGFLVFAGTTADWYFTPRDEKGCKKRGGGPGALTRFPICSALKRTMLYHLGTVCLCALIIAIVQFVRYMILYLEAQTKGEPPNRLQKALFSALHCYLRCLECCLDKLNKNALIWTAIWGDGFFVAACEAFGLLWRNLCRVAAINTVSGILLTICKIAVACMNTAIFFAVFSYYTDISTRLSSPTGPCIVVFILSWGVAVVFMSVFHAIIDTVFLCFLVDSETNPAGQMLAGKNLQKIVGKYAAESEKQGNEMKKMRAKRPGVQTTDGNVQHVEVKPKDS